MNRVFLYLLLAGMCFAAVCCSGDSRDDGKVLAKINNYDLSQGEFMRQLATEMEMRGDVGLTPTFKQEFLESVIKKELLIQEAKRLKLDSREEFIRSIERYWESMLIRDLMEMKGREIEKEATVSMQQIRERYNALKKSGEKISTFEEMRAQIAEELKDRKKTLLLKEWMEELRKKADISIDKALLDKD